MLARVRRLKQNRTTGGCIKGLDEKRRIAEVVKRPKMVIQRVRRPLTAVQEYIFHYAVSLFCKD